MDRYAYTRIYRDNTLKRFYGSILYPNLQPKSSDIYIYVNSGDRLDLLASKYYGDVTFWWVIADANPGTFKGSFNILPGTRIRIPYPIYESSIDNLQQTINSNR